MWSLILRKDDDVYDVIPNTWLKDSETTFYPNVNIKTAKLYAKTCAKPEKDWEEIVIKIIKRDYGK